MILRPELGLIPVWHVCNKKTENLDSVSDDADTELERRMSYGTITVTL
jgi:hypothetical protein